MGLLHRFTSAELATSAADASALRDVLSAVGTVDGSVDTVERAVLEALWKTLPQLRDHPSSAPPRSNRARILEELARLEDEALRYQCWVVAVELAIASDGINEAEDRYLEELQQALRIDMEFASMTVRVMACKYARAAAE
jgi:tellurite resistance protein